MNFKNMTQHDTILFTHNDLDAAGCAIAFRLAGFSKIKFCGNDQVNSTIENFMKNPGLVKHVLIADICPSKDVLEKLASKFEVMIFDHHYSAKWLISNQVLKNWQKYLYIGSGITGQLESGCSTMLKNSDLVKRIEDNIRLNNPNSIDLFYRLIDIIRLYDTWEWVSKDEEDARSMNILFSMLRMNGFCDHYFNRIMNDPCRGHQTLFTSSVNEFIMAKLESENDALNNVDYSKFIPIMINGHQCALTFHTQGCNFNDLSHRYLDEFPSCEMVIYYLHSFGTMQIRSRNDVNCAELIAIPNGGGGHPQASGCSISQSYLDRINDIVIEFLQNTPN